MRHNIRQSELNDINSLFDIDLKSFEAPWDVDIWKSVCDDTLFNKVVTTVQGTAVGFIVWRQTTTTDIWRLAVKPAYRRQGIGTDLIKTAIEFAKGNTVVIPVPESICYANGVGRWLNKRGFKANRIIKGDGTEDSFQFEYKTC